MAPRRRVSLSNLGGPVDLAGDPKRAEALAQVLTAADRPGADADALTHGFHTYPARMHPAVAGAALDLFGAPACRVLDPFCGSGTVLVEAQRRAMRALGVDLNPLALRLSEVRTSVRPQASRDGFEATLQEVAAASEARVRGRVAVRAPLPKRELVYYDSHVLLELAGLHAEIQGVDDEQDRRALEMVFSSLLVKVSRQHADTSDRLSQKRIRKGLPTELFLRKGRELSARWAALHAALPSAASEPRLVLADARQLRTSLPVRAAAQLVLSSPPYGGTYDYHGHHARRYPWLGMSDGRFARQEIGARRHLSRAPDAHKRWHGELLAVLRSIGSVLAADGHVLLLLGDAQLGRRRVDALAQLRELSPQAQLRVLAAASQARPDPHRGVPRREHLILLTHSAKI